jgi:4-hydroxy-3-polyprenylbenzoate decarboxylase
VTNNTPVKDLRGQLRLLEEQNRLVRVSRAINKDTELHPLVRWQFRGLKEKDRKAFLFENVTDSRGRAYKMPVVVGALAGSQEIYNFGLACGDEEVYERWQKAFKHPIPPVMIDAAPVHEVVHAGASLLEHGGLDEFPVPISTPGFDNAPYLNSSIWVVKDPETGIRNMGVYRGQVKGPLRTGIMGDAKHDFGRIWEKYNARGLPMPAAAVIGASPSVYYAAIEVMPFGTDEIDIAGALEGRPVELVRCKTIDLEVPAHAEIILEGIVRTDLLEPEGSFGEAHGYCDPRFLGMVFEITAITHRKDPVFLSIISQLTPSESSKSKQKGYEAESLRYLRDTCGFTGVVHVSLYENLLNRQFGVVKLKKSGAHKVLDILETFAARKQAPKFIVAVDDDIDGENPLAVNWAIVNRSQPHRDVRIIHPRPLPFGPLQYAADGVGYDREDSALLIDATKKTILPPVALPARPYMEQALKIWNELGLPAVEPDGPWFGYSLGDWSEVHAAEASLAVQGRYYETGEKLAAECVKTEPGTKLGSLHRHLRK